MTNERHRQNQGPARESGRWPGVPMALGAALLFGAGVPAVKVLLAGAAPWLVAGVLYLGAGLGTGLPWLALRLRHGTHREAPLRLADLPWLAGAIAAGGVAAPVLLVFGLRESAAAPAALLLNLEGVFTLLLAWTALRENVDRRVALGALAIVAGAALLSWQGWAAPTPGALLIAGACLLWALDNTLSRQVSAADPLQVAAIKGACAGAVNVTLALTLGATWPAAPALLGVLVVGALGYGLSLALYVAALRHLGSGRAAAYFGLAPFAGAALGVLVLGEPLTGRLLGAGALMALGLWLHLAERHDHLHAHSAFEHEHAHVHDAHHRHGHARADPLGEPHSHRHLHAPLIHGHPHFPDLHHRHGHDAQEPRP